MDTLVADNAVAGRDQGIFDGVDSATGDTQSFMLKAI